MAPPDQSTKLLGNEQNGTKNASAIITSDPEKPLKNSNSLVLVHSPENGNFKVLEEKEYLNADKEYISTDKDYINAEKEAEAQMVCSEKPGGDRETWDKKLDFLLSVIGFAVDLGNVWRFPTVCYQNGGGAFLIPYFIMLVFGGLPLFYMELALGQYQRCGCISVWSRICPMFKGIGFGICVIASYVAMYYNTIIAWAVYFLFNSFRWNVFLKFCELAARIDEEHNFRGTAFDDMLFKVLPMLQVPWATCDNDWNTENCQRIVDGPDTSDHSNSSIGYTYANTSGNLWNWTIPLNGTNGTELRKPPVSSAAEEYFEREVLEIYKSAGLHDVGGIKLTLVACLIFVFLLVYFSLWKGIKSSGKAVWITATLPYAVLLILLVRGVTLPGAAKGITYYLTPQWETLIKTEVWTAAASQIFFSLGPGFGVLLALSSYNKFNNNCYKDALVTASINCMTSFLAGFVVFSVLGYMALKQGVEVKDVAKSGPGLVFVVYPEAIATLTGSSFWAIIFFLMLITLGLDSTFGGLEALITGVCDEWPQIGKRRELFVAGLIVYCFCGALATTTYGGQYVVDLLDTRGAPISILFICFLEALAISWFYGVDRFSDDLEKMLGFRPGIFWRICWKYISPVFLIVLFILSCVNPIPLDSPDYQYPGWAKSVGWLITSSSIIPIPIYMLYRWLSSGMAFSRNSLDYMIKPEQRPGAHSRAHEENNVLPVSL